MACVSGNCMFQTLAISTFKSEQSRDQLSFGHTLLPLKIQHRSRHTCLIHSAGAFFRREKMRCKRDR
ncbi:hypothetical protein SRHO_G00044680 [Serrasalmus rhombeus]